MAREALLDKLQVYPFWLMDIAPVDSLGVPVLTPLYGFSAITSPEIIIETQEIKECNWHFSTVVVKSASVGNITLQRGATFADSDFYRWITVVLGGNAEALQSRGTGAFALAQGIGGTDAALRFLNFPGVTGLTFRRDLLLIQFFARSALTGEETLGLNTILTAGLPVLGGGITPALGQVVGNISGSGGGPTNPFLRLPAKAWMLRGCVPVRYKPGGDFDAMSSDVSIQELEVAVDLMEEISLAA